MQQTAGGGRRRRYIWIRHVFTDHVDRCSGAAARRRRLSFWGGRVCFSFRGLVLCVRTLTLNTPPKKT